MSDLDIKTWYEARTDKDLVRSVRVLNQLPVTGATPSDIVQVDRPTSDKLLRSSIRYVMTEAGITFAQLSETVTVRNKIAVWVRGLPTVNEKTDMLATYVPMFWQGWVQFLNSDISAEDDDTYPVEQGLQPIYGTSLAETWGRPNITVDQLQEIVR